MEGDDNERNPLMGDNWAALGLVFGAAVGVLVGALLGGQWLGYAPVAGAAIGLILTAAARAMKTKG